MVANRAKGCNCNLDYSLKYNDKDKSFTASVYGIKKNDDNAAFTEARADLNAIVTNTGVINERFEKTTKMADNTEIYGGSYFESATNTIWHADHWMKKDWDIGGQPKFPYIVDKPATTMDTPGYYLEKLWGGSDYKLRATHYYELWESQNHENIHALRALQHILTNSREFEENKAIDRMNIMYQKLNMPIRPPFGK